MLTAVGPPKTLAPPRTSVPVPAFVSPALLKSGVVMFVVAPVPSALTVMVGVPVVTASVRLLDGSLSAGTRFQLAADEVVVSPKVMFPMVRAKSSWTTAFAVRLSVLKSAVEPAPLATVPPSQFAVLLHAPPEGLTHVPLATVLMV